MGPILDFLDGRLLRHTLRKNEKKRLELLKDTVDRGETLPGWRVVKPVLYVFGGQFILMVLTSWVVSLSDLLLSESKCLPPGPQMGIETRRRPGADMIAVPLLHSGWSSTMRTFSATFPHAAGLQKDLRATLLKRTRLIGLHRGPSDQEVIPIIPACIMVYGILMTGDMTAQCNDRRNLLSNDESCPLVIGLHTLPLPLQ